jgi:hypothetical protein
VSEVKNVVDLTNHIIEAINDFSDDRELTNGEVLSAVFSTLLNISMASPNFDPKEFAAELTGNIEDAMRDPRLH